tara:strand:+ start:695 stop:2398 length:1704 start_codon:yes stop_codon:yes gene_type:complete
MALPEYNRTVLRQTLEADMSSARYWESLANTLDNFASQAGSFTRNMMASEKAKAKAQKDANELATKTFLDGMEADIIEAAHKSSIDNPTDYEAYITQFDSQAKVWLESEGLDSMLGARAGLERMIDLKRQKFGEKPYEATQKLIKEDSLNTAKRNITTDVDDYIYSAGEYIEQFSNMPLDAVMSNAFENYKGETLKQFQKLQQKVTDLVTVHDLDAETAGAYELEMQNKYITGVMEKLMAVEVNNNNGANALAEFYTNPNKFLRNREYIAALIPEGVKIDETLKKDIYKELNTYLSDYQKEQKRLDDIEEAELTANQSETFTALKAGLQTGADLDLRNIEEAWQAEDISDSQYESLLDDIRKGTYEIEDEETKWELSQQMIDGELSLQAKTKLIDDALEKNLINAASAQSFLTKADSAASVTSQDYWSQANSAIGRAFGVNNDGSFLSSGSGPTEEDLTNMRFAQEELYRRVANGEKAIEIYNEIITKYKKNEDAEQLPLGSMGNKSLDSAVVLKNDFNTYWVGTPERVDGIATQIKIAKDLEAGLINDDTADRMIASLRDYLKKDF